MSLERDAHRAEKSVGTPLKRYAVVSKNRENTPGVWQGAYVTLIEGKRQTTRPATKEEVDDTYWMQRGYKTKSSPDLTNIDNAYIKVCEARNLHLQGIYSKDARYAKELQCFMEIKKIKGGR